MVDPIQARGLTPGITPMTGPGSGAPTSGAQQPGGVDFKQVLLSSLNEVNRLQQEADQGVQRLVTGEADNVAEVLATVNKAGIAFDLLMEVRNKLTDAYKEVQQMSM